MVYSRKQIMTLKYQTLKIYLTTSDDHKFTKEILNAKTK